LSFLNSLNISGSALTAQKLRMDIIAQNIANADTTRTQDGGPYRRKMVVFRPLMQDVPGAAGAAGRGEELSGVAVSAILEDQRELKPVYNPTHPDADENGYVMMPNVNTVEEMIDMISATRSYEANITASTRSSSWRRARWTSGIGRGANERRERT
jgi:flagellar basal-body rod protein FlgC